MVSLMVILMLVVSGASAQFQFNQTFCGDLPEADCAILQQSKDAMMAVESAAFDMDMNFAMSTTPANDIDAFAFGLVGGGAFAGDPELMQSMKPTSPEEVSDMMEAMPEMLPELIQSVTGQMTLQVSSSDMPEMSFDMLMTDGVIYLDTAPFTGEDEPVWMGMDLVAMFDTMSGEMTPGMDEMGSMFDMAEIMQLNMFTHFSDPEYLKQFMTITRLDDAEVDGQAVAVFELVLDYGKLFGNEQFQADFSEYMQMFMGAQGASDDEMAEFNMVMEAIYSMFDNSEMRMEHWVGLTDFYTYHMDMKLDLNMDMSVMGEMTGGDDAPESINMTMDFVLDMYDFNEPVEVTVPADAQIVDPAAMFMGNAESF